MISFTLFYDPLFTLFYSAANWLPYSAGDIATAISLEPAVKFNGGGHINHSVFWTNLSPACSGRISHPRVEGFLRVCSGTYSTCTYTIYTYTTCILTLHYIYIYLHYTILTYLTLFLLHLHYTYTLTGDIKELIERDFSSFDKFKELMSTQSLGIQGSGWSWLGWNPRHGRLRLTTCPNQDPLSMQGTIIHPFLLQHLILYIELSSLYYNTLYCI